MIDNYSIEYPMKQVDKLNYNIIDNINSYNLFLIILLLTDGSKR